jgi:hypothetical protein
VISTKISRDHAAEPRTGQPGDVTDLPAERVGGQQLIAGHQPGHHQRQQPGGLQQARRDHHPLAVASPIGLCGEGR